MGNKSKQRKPMKDATGKVISPDPRWDRRRNIVEAGMPAARNGSTWHGKAERAIAVKESVVVPSPAPAGLVAGRQFHGVRPMPVVYNSSNGVPKRRYPAKPVVVTPREVRQPWQKKRA